MGAMSENQFSGSLEVRPKVALVVALCHPRCSALLLQKVCHTDLQIAH